jgi:hypothetical protein
VISVRVSIGILKIALHIVLKVEIHEYPEIQTIFFALDIMKNSNTVPSKSLFTSPE